jgi:RimJ/RimL family protein N-acetyltransferase
MGRNQSQPDRSRVAPERSNSSRIVETQLEHEMQPTSTPQPTPNPEQGIRLEPATAAWLEALVEGDDAFTKRFGIVVVPGWAGFPEALPHALQAARLRDRDPWGSHLIFDHDDALVGFGGFKGAPVDGTVEVGYAVAPQRQGHGIATAATRWMIDQARLRGCERVIAHTLAEASPSTSVLQRCGFVHTATVAEPDGDVTDNVWRWDLVLSGGGRDVHP